MLLLSHCLICLACSVPPEPRVPWMPLRIWKAYAAPVFCFALCISCLGRRGFFPQPRLAERIHVESSHVDKRRAWDQYVNNQVTKLPAYELRA
ncbi:hypothetical protein E2C01_029362 [Portunus trituberculatus]|uniref:Uncharacterized protein n=1 Tax=Portunus trituberculatus TaxID=210409 RepID=A0A5B7ESP5_PORTR|nr:hypothetical protein [Portunus trituberculatus]